MAEKNPTTEVCCKSNLQRFARDASVHLLPTYTQTTTDACLGRDLDRITEGVAQQRFFSVQNEKCCYVLINILTSIFLKYHSEIGPKSPGFNVNGGVDENYFLL